MNYDSCADGHEKATYIKSIDDVRVGDYLVDTTYLEMNSQITQFYRVVKLTWKSVTIEKNLSDGSNIPKPVRLSWEPLDDRHIALNCEWGGSFRNKSRRLSFCRFVKAADLDAVGNHLDPTSH
jgi:hypothetical protein